MLADLHTHTNTSHGHHSAAEHRQQYGHKHHFWFHR